MTANIEGLERSGWHVGKALSRIISFRKGNVVVVKTAHGWSIYARDTKELLGREIDIPRAVNRAEELL